MSANSGGKGVNFWPIDDTRHDKKANSRECAVLNQIEGTLECFVADTGPQQLCINMRLILHILHLLPCHLHRVILCSEKENTIMVPTFVELIGPISPPLIGTGGRCT